MNMDDFELEKLRNEIQQEKQMKEMLEQSAAELRATVEELEKRYDTIDNEGNEWKTRFETQQEMNEQLERQILMLQNKVQEAKTNLKDDEEAEKEKKGITDENEHGEEKQSQSSPASNSNKSKSRVTIVTGNDDTPFSDNNTDNKEQATKEVEAKKGVQIKKEVQSKKEMQPKKEVQSKKEMQANKEEQAKNQKVKMEKEKSREKPSNESTVIRGILKNKGIQVDASGIKSETPAIQSKVKNRNKRPVSSGHLEKQGTKVIILTDRTPKRFIKIDPKVYLSHEVRPPARRQAWESSAPIETENKIDKDEKVRIFGSTRLKNISYKEKFIQSKQQRSMMQQSIESGDKTSNIRGDLTFRNSDTLRKNRRSKKYARNGASQKVGAMEEPLQQSDSKEQSNRKKTVKEFMAERQQDDDVEARTQKNSSLEKNSRKTPVKEQTSGKPPTETSNKTSSEKAENSALVRSVSDGKVIMKRAEKTDLEENVRKAKSEIIQVKRNEKSTKTPDVKKSSEPSVANEIPANDPQDTLQENEVDDIKPTSKFPRTIKIRTKPGSYLRAKAYVAARDLASRGSKTNQSEYSPEDLSKFLPEEWSKPGTAMTKSTGISINIAISPRGAGKTPRDLKNFDDLSDPTGYHVRMLEKQKIVLGNQLKELQDRLDHESQANPHMIRMLDKEKNVLHNQLRDMEWRLDQESKANAHMVQMLEREKHILQGQLRDLEWRLDQESKPNLRVVQSLEKRKNMLQNQLRDIEWRIDQESKAYHKANDERKSYALEINTTKGVISELVTKQKMSSSREHLETIPGSRTPRAMGSRQTMSDASAIGDGSLRSILSAHSSTSSQGSNKRVQWSPQLATPATEKSSRISLNDGDTPSPVDSPRRSKIKVRHTNYRSIRQLENEIREMGNIPEDRRILDPKRGPIQKTAAVKNLPSLEST